ncbi:MAG TPA: flagellar biosynthetic protein FliO [Candidatus Ozemobacteraceae bacterium]|nr:flagellar biosynthetic protein FliO [Candidatus Ozemobacteraceae bacterium]HQG30245.1 flagellar biosynthetic protein FliO [Candidatus Ozemobacteraceae bacterium]
MIAALRPAGLFLFAFILFSSISYAAGTASDAARPDRSAPPPALATSQGSAFAVAAASESTDLPLFSRGETTAASPFLNDPDPVSTTLSILTSLALIVGMIVAVTWVLQKRHGLSGTACGRTLGILPIDGRRFIYIVDIMGRILVLGVTEHHISMLCEITDRALIDSLRIQPGGAPTVPGLDKVFAFLKRSAVKPASENTSAPEEPSDVSFADHTRKAQERIRKMEDMILRRPDSDDDGRP